MAYQQQKTEFNKIIVSLMDKIDEVSSKLNTGEYVEMANMLRDLNGMSVFKEIQVIQQNIQQTAHYQRIRETVRNPKKKSKEIADKLDNKKYYKFCDRCDTTVCRDGFKKHQERAICKKIWTSKLMSKNTKAISSEKSHKLAQILTPNFMTHYDELSKIIVRTYSEILSRNVLIKPSELFDNTECSRYTDYYDYYREEATWKEKTTHTDIAGINWIKDGKNWKIDNLLINH